MKTKNMSKKKKPFTWATLKKIVSKIPNDRLNDEVIIWTGRDDDASGFIVKDVEILKEDHLQDDEGCTSKSVMKETIDEEKKAGTHDPTDYPVVLYKGQRILYAE